MVRRTIVAESMESPDPQPFAAAFADAAPALLAWASLRVRGPLRRRIEPEDLVQEVAMRAAQRFADYDPARGPFRAWLLGFAHRIWLETLRELARDPLGAVRRTGGDSRLPGLADTITAISQAAMRSEGMAACLRRIEQLPPDEQTLLTCLGIEGLSHQETAALLGIGADACRKRWQRLREDLRQDPVLAGLLQA